LGIKTFAWDQRGFGKSAIKKAEWGKTGGIDKALEDMDYFVKKLKDEAQKDKLPVFLWGHSMVRSFHFTWLTGQGGALALMYAANGPEKDMFRGVVAQSPLIKLAKPPSKVLVFLVSFIYKVLPNFQLYTPVPVIPQLSLKS